MVRMRPGSKHFDGDALVVAKAAGELATYGLEPRHLRAFKTAADREVGLLEQVVAPIRRQRDAGAQARADEAVRDIAALSVKLHATPGEVRLCRGADRRSVLRTAPSGTAGAGIG